MGKVAPWVQCDFADGKSGRCDRCGEELRLGLPMRVEVWIAAVRAFVKAHSECKELAKGGR